MSSYILSISISFFDREYLGEKVTDICWCAGIILGTLLLKRPLAILLARISSNLAIPYKYADYKNVLRNMFSKPVQRLLMTVMFYIAVSRLSNLLDKVVIHHIPGIRGEVSVKLTDVADHIFLFLFIIFLTRVVANFFEFIYYLRMNTARDANNTADMQLLPMIREISKMGVWIVCTFWIFGSVFHVNVPALVTGLGIGGVAIALAGKETVENFFAAFTLISDKPFKTGDYIRVGEVEGLVIQIGFRSTHIRTNDGSKCVIPNQKLVSQSLVNLTVRDNYGVKIVLNIKYGISLDALQQLTDELRITLINTPPILPNVDIWIENFGTQTISLTVFYRLPFPIPDNFKLIPLKQEVSMLVFGIATKYGELGVPIV